ncbi:hypothetical protein EDI_044400 [Entamoeba dispar SAW760]|uniref:Uncharacterized protein n=1 Tax=Entamoeba dispar (strain ATCC PRA-260 / SAW760) TaxID=370354 RepID=B0EHU0_ENTDS|nr:uncharacterized protein EDI_044400 [Entamoeba dispar SAW760]EDR25884.1 hypothetical protein EDI_044400 [Entamoeba dispar SAW760]|eukprot:EDR25884.1 hypothetical protein EDI_044400 [Entamoeba dispar SAW760]
MSTQSHSPRPSFSDIFFSSESGTDGEVLNKGMPPLCFLIESIHLKGGLEHLGTIYFILRYYSGRSQLKENLIKGIPITIFNITNPHICLYFHTKTTKIGYVTINLDEFDRIVINRRFQILFNSSFHATTPMALQSTIRLSFNSISTIQLIQNSFIPFNIGNTLEKYNRPDIEVKLIRVGDVFFSECQSNLLKKPLPLLLPNFTQNDTEIEIFHNNLNPQNRLFKIIEKIEPHDLLSYELVSIPPTENNKIVLDNFLSCINWKELLINKRKTSFQIMDFDEKGRVVIKQEETFPGYFVRINSKKKMVKLWLTNESMFDWALVHVDKKDMHYYISLYANPLQKHIKTQFNDYEFSTSMVLKVPLDVVSIHSLTFFLYELQPFNSSLTTMKSLFPLF